MASTRNNNTIGNYKCEEATYKKNLERNLSLNSSYAPPNKPARPYGGSAPPSFMYGSSLSNNSVDIESALFGINSTNLVEPMKPVTPSIKKLNNIKYFTRDSVVMPPPLVVNNNQRILPLNL